MAESIQTTLINARRAHILDVAAQVFSQKGFHPTTIRDIAREAGVADGTIYNYFENKTALLLGIFDRMREAALRDFDPMPAAALDLRAFLRVFISYPLQAFRTDNFALFKVVMAEVLVNPEMRALYHQKMMQQTFANGAAYLQHWADQHPETLIDVQLTIQTLFGLILGVIMQQIITDGALDTNWDALPDFLTDLVLNSIERNRS